MGFLTYESQATCECAPPEFPNPTGVFPEIKPGAIWQCRNCGKKWRVGSIAEDGSATYQRFYD